MIKNIFKSHFVNIKAYKAMINTNWNQSRVKRQLDSSEYLPKYTVKVIGLFLIENFVG